SPTGRTTTRPRPPTNGWPRRTNIGLPRKQPGPREDRHAPSGSGPSHLLLGGRRKRRRPARSAGRHWRGGRRPTSAESYQRRCSPGPPVRRGPGERPERDNRSGHTYTHGPLPGPHRAPPANPYPHRAVRTPSCCPPRVAVSVGATCPPWGLSRIILVLG